MFVLGIDPGLSRCGYAIVSAGRPRPTPHAVGVLRTSSSDDRASRLAELQAEIRALVSEFSPSVMAVERVLFQVNARTAMSVAQAVGVIMAEAASAGLEVTEYSPNEVKQVVAGWGGASKVEVQRMVQTQLGLAARPEPPDAADAAAVALCHLAHAPMAARLARSPR